jgi:hypothetical protein
MSQYINAAQIHINEVAVIDFIENTQTGGGIVAKVCMLYTTLKELHKAMGDAIEQHDKRLGELQRSKSNMN